MLVANAQQLPIVLPGQWFAIVKESAGRAVCRQSGQPDCGLGSIHHLHGRCFRAQIRFNPAGMS